MTDMAIPNLYILGAPKCGTSTLANWMRHHPGIVTPDAKEPHFFYSPYGPTMDRDTYESLYRGHDSAATTYLDASVWYLFGRTAVPEILAESPDARFVVCLRNPVDMVPSLHAQKLLTGHEKLAGLREAWDVADARASGSTVGIFGLPGGDPAHMSYKAACLLGEQVEHVLTIVDRSQVLFVLIEDIAERPEETWRLVCEHAGVETAAIDFERANVADIQRRSQLGHRLVARMGTVKESLGLTGKSGLLAPLVRLNIRRERYAPPPADLRCEIATYFEEDVKLLESTIGRDLQHWRTVETHP